MKFKKSILFVIVIIFGVLTHALKAQNVITTKTSSKYEKYIDSLKKEPYKWHFPIMGQEIREKGFDIPYPSGLTLQYVYGKMDVDINNLRVGFNPDPSGWSDVDSIATFNYINPNSHVALLRYDVWLLPFLNVYGMGGYEVTDTKVELATPFILDFTTGSIGPVVGWGATISAGVDHWFLTADYNQAWTFVAALDKPAFSQEADIRIGRTFDFKKNRPWSNISVMAGGSWLQLNSKSQGNANLTKIFGVGKNKPEMLDKLNNWWDGLGPKEQEKLQPLYDALSGWLEDDSDTIIYYGFNKKLPQAWSMTLGANYQINHRWSINTIYTFLGSREQFTLGLNYRFGFKGKNLFAGDIDRKNMHKVKQ
jgi:opacity protein-like surface antigen